MRAITVVLECWLVLCPTSAVLQVDEMKRMREEMKVGSDPCLTLVRLPA